MTASRCRTVVLVAAIGLSGCGGSDDPVTTTTTANVEGYWTVQSVNNAGSATFTACTGDLTPLEGVTVAGTGAVAATLSSCVNDQAQYTSPTASDFIFSTVHYSCDNGNYGYIAGGGTVNGNNFHAQLEHVSQYYGYTGSDIANGVMTGPATFQLSEYLITASGSTNGSCNISPPLSYSMGIVTASPSQTQSATGWRPLSDELIGRLKRAG